MEPFSIPSSSASPPTQGEEEMEALWRELHISNNGGAPRAHFGNIVFHLRNLQALAPLYKASMRISSQLPLFSSLFSSLKNSPKETNFSIFKMKMDGIHHWDPLRERKSDKILADKVYQKYCLSEPESPLPKSRFDTNILEKSHEISLPKTSFFKNFSFPSEHLPEICNALNMMHPLNAQDLVNNTKFSILLGSDPQEPHRINETIIWNASHHSDEETSTQKLQKTLDGIFSSKDILLGIYQGKHDREYTKEAPAVQTACGTLEKGSSFCGSFSLHKHPRQNRPQKYSLRVHQDRGNGQFAVYRLSDLIRCRSVTSYLSKIDFIKHQKNSYLSVERAPNGQHCVRFPAKLPINVLLPQGTSHRGNFKVPPSPSTSRFPAPRGPR